MRFAVPIAALTVLLSIQGDPANPPTPSEEQFLQGDPSKTVYATNHHMGFSLRSSVIHWLGGVPIVDERDLRSSEREKWWGAQVPLLSEEALRTSDR
jgi:hypothetical protein